MDPLQISRTRTRRKPRRPCIPSLVLPCRLPDLAEDRVYHPLLLRRQVPRHAINPPHGSSLSSLRGCKVPSPNRPTLRPPSRDQTDGGDSRIIRPTLLPSGRVTLDPLHLEHPSPLLLLYRGSRPLQRMNTHCRRGLSRLSRSSPPRLLSREGMQRPPLRHLLPHPTALCPPRQREVTLRLCLDPSLLSSPPRQPHGRRSLRNDLLVNVHCQPHPQHRPKAMPQRDVSVCRRENDSLQARLRCLGQGEAPLRRLPL